MSTDEKFVGLLMCSKILPSQWAPQDIYGIHIMLVARFGVLFFPCGGN